MLNDLLYLPSTYACNVVPLKVDFSRHNTKNSLRSIKFLISQAHETMGLSAQNGNLEIKGFVRYFLQGPCNI